MRAFEGLEGIEGGGAKLPIVENWGGDYSRFNCCNCFVTLFVVNPVTTRSTPIKQTVIISYTRYVLYILLNHRIYIVIYDIRYTIYDVFVYPNRVLVHNCRLESSEIGMRHSLHLLVITTTISFPDDYCRHRLLYNTLSVRHTHATACYIHTYARSTGYSTCRSTGRSTNIFMSASEIAGNFIAPLVEMQRVEIAQWSRSATVACAVASAAARLSAQIYECLISEWEPIIVKHT